MKKKSLQVDEQNCLIIDGFCHFVTCSSGKRLTIFGTVTPSCSWNEKLETADYIRQLYSIIFRVNILVVSINLNAEF